MDALFEQPHTADVTHPERTRDAGSNVGELNYTSPPAEKITVKCMLQMRGGSRGILDEGAVYPIDAIMYTTDERVRVDDLVEPQTPDTIKDFRYLITSVQFKDDVDGAGRHLACSLTRSQRT